jgi:hypothetical protein
MVVPQFDCLTLHLLADPANALLPGLCARATVRSKILRHLPQRVLIGGARWDRVRDEPMSRPKLLKLLARPTGFEPVTFAFVGHYLGFAAGSFDLRPFAIIHISSMFFVADPCLLLL